jgi:putative effector of murein hydrolase
MNIAMKPLEPGEIQGVIRGLAIVLAGIITVLSTPILLIFFAYTNTF